MKRSVSTLSLNNIDNSSSRKNAISPHDRKVGVGRVVTLLPKQQEQLGDNNGKLTTARSSLEVATSSNTRNNKRGVGSDVAAQVQVLDTGVQLCARKLNEAKAHADKLDDELSKKLDELKDLHSERIAINSMRNGTRGEAHLIEDLSKKIEKINEASEQQMYYRLQLNHVEDTSKKKSLVMDGMMRGLTDSVEASERELAKFERALGEVQSSHTKALRDLENATKELELERQQRNSELSRLQYEAGNAERMKAWRLEQQGSRTAAIEEPFRSSSNHDKDKKMRSVRERRAEVAQLRSELQAKISSSNDLEESFKKMKEATGANTLAEMLGKFSQFDERRDRLLKEQKDAEERLGAAKIAVENASVRFNNIKENGVGDTEVNHDVINHLNESIALEKVECKVISSLNERMESVLVGLRQGVIGLYQRLLPFHATFLEGEAPQLSERDTTSAIQGAHDTVEILEVSEKILEKMLAEVGGVECISNTNKLSPSYLGLRENSDADETLENPNLGESNCRIQVKEVSPRTNHIPKTDSDDSSNDNIMTNGVNSLSDSNYHLVPSRSYLKQECQKLNERSLPQGEIHRNKRKPRELLSNQKDTQYTDFGSRPASAFSNNDGDPSK